MWGGGGYDGEEKVLYYQGFPNYGAILLREMHKIYPEMTAMNTPIDSGFDISKVKHNTRIPYPGAHIFIFRQLHGAKPGEKKI